jgi:pyridoxal phosphate enzyme (YggS family)
LAERVTFAGLDAARVRENLEHVRERITAAGRDPGDVQVCAAIKYVPADELGVLALAGIEVVGENRAQDLIEKQERVGDDAFAEWHFIGALQSRKVRDVAPRVALIHSVGSDSALAQFEKHPAREVLVQVNVAGEKGKAGIAPGELGEFVARCPVPVGGLMTMPPFVERAEDNRRHFAALAELAASHGLEKLSMGTTQDFEVAVAEGATIVRLGTVLYE